MSALVLCSHLLYHTTTLALARLQIMFLLAVYTLLQVLSYTGPVPSRFHDILPRHLGCPVLQLALCVDSLEMEIVSNNRIHF